MTSNVKITSDGIICTNCEIDVSGGNIYTDTPEVDDISNIVPTTQWVNNYISGLTGIPIGGIIMWGGETIPIGWALCDGSGTYIDINGNIQNIPNLSGRFILGSGNFTDSSGNTVTDSSGNIVNYSLGQTEGQINVTLSIDEIPSHSHEITDDGHAHETYVNDVNETDTGNENTNLINNAGTTLALTSSTSQTGIIINDTGGGNSHNNMPPYYVLAYIIRIS